MHRLFCQLRQLTCMAALTVKQIEIVSKMRDGYGLFVGVSEMSGKHFQYISKGFHNIYFRADTFAKLINNGLIHQQNHRPYDWVLTGLGETCQLKAGPLPNNGR